ncbi:hypothetical protein [Amycolatopsis sp. WAC 04197]|uniref:hypothetical protein n=1 Tax=Amycolatopsis sp. WAC 04197 TaxID=2203199 RepID=UPI000F7836F4|nr:hypothetical protein [Amycolatopsis sp. WAC 04197]
MQVTPKADYPVEVRSRRWEVDGPQAVLHEGIWDVLLNRMVTVSFVPDIGQPVHDRARSTTGLDEITTERQARLEAAMFADYTVTPNTELAGRTTRSQTTFWRGLVFYVDPAEYARQAADLRALDVVGATVSELRGHPAVDFIERIVASPEFADEDAFWLRGED